MNAIPDDKDQGLNPALLPWIDALAARAASDYLANPEAFEADPDYRSKLPVRTCLYRQFDADGHLLYVGVSVDPRSRKQGHRNASPWFPRIARITEQWFHSSKEALAAERQAIRTEGPLFNVRSKVP